MDKATAVRADDLREQLDAAADTFANAAERFIAEGGSYTVAMCKVLAAAERLRFPAEGDHRGGMAVGFQWKVARDRGEDRGDFPPQ